MSQECAVSVRRKQFILEAMHTFIKGVGVNTVSPATDLSLGRPRVLLAMQYRSKTKSKLVAYLNEKC